MIRSPQKSPRRVPHIGGQRITRQGRSSAMGGLMATVDASVLLWNIKKYQELCDVIQETRPEVGAYAPYSDIVEKGTSSNYAPYQEQGTYVPNMPARKVVEKAWAKTATQVVHGLVAVLQKAYFKTRYSNQLLVIDKEGLKEAFRQALLPTVAAIKASAPVFTGVYQMFAFAFGDTPPPEQIMELKREAASMRRDLVAKMGLVPWEVPWAL